MEREQNEEEVRDAAPENCIQTAATANGREYFQLTCCTICDANKLPSLPGRLEEYPLLYSCFERTTSACKKSHQ